MIGLSLFFRFLRLLIKSKKFLTPNSGLPAQITPRNVFFEEKIKFSKNPKFEFGRKKILTASGIEPATFGTLNLATYRYTTEPCGLPFAELFSKFRAPWAALIGTGFKLILMFFKKIRKIW